ncbi:hypothetical protein [Streptomyces sp. NPDC057686]|uniref:hypothetical protein n=1 Tax=Streptomyces sp. NPDC057686 TaxID=3346212 RepID=UPI0036A232B6
MGRRLATFQEVDLVQGKGWEEFPGVDLWQCFAAREQLRRIVQSQALCAPQVFFGEVSA